MLGDQVTVDDAVMEDETMTGNHNVMVEEDGVMMENSVKMRDKAMMRDDQVMKDVVMGGVVMLFGGMGVDAKEETRDTRRGHSEPDPPLASWTVTPGSGRRPGCQDQNPNRSPTPRRIYLHSSCCHRGSCFLVLQTRKLWMTTPAIGPKNQIRARMAIARCQAGDTPS